MPNPPAGWYPDPSGSLTLRWWDGTRWTDDALPRAPDLTARVEDPGLEPRGVVATALFLGAAVVMVIAESIIVELSALAVLLATLAVSVVARRRAYGRWLGPLAARARASGISAEVMIVADHESQWVRSWNPFRVLRRDFWEARRSGLLAISQEDITYLPRTGDAVTISRRAVADAAVRRRRSGTALVEIVTRTGEAHLFRFLGDSLPEVKRALGARTAE